MADANDEITKAVIPAAGLGTRFLPATKATPKEMLPVVDTPAIQYVVEEAVSAGLHDVLVITGRGKGSIENHFDRNSELEDALEAKGDEEGLALIRASSNLADMYYVRQGAAKGLGHAVLCAADHVGDVPFAVLLGDDLIDRRDPLLRRMIDVRKRYGGSIVALMEVEPDQVSSYGVVAIKPTAVDDGGSGSREGGVHGVLFRGRRYDTGNKLDYLRTQVQLACERPDIARQFVPWLRGYLDRLP